MVPSPNSSRLDYRIITELIQKGSRVLDLGCGNGELLAMLVEEKAAIGQGVEISEEGINACIAQGLNVIQGDLDEGLADYADHSFDYVVLNQTLQVVHKPDLVLKEMIRVGKQGIVGFPNFAHWAVRGQLFFKGMMPRTPELPFEWFNTPNIHLLTIRDFERFCRGQGIQINRKIYIKGRRSVSANFLPNLLAQTAIYVISQVHRARGEAADE
jgi:methionine biosynthesis protein MetW